MAGFSHFTKAAKPLPLPTIAETPSEQTLMELLQLIMRYKKTHWSLKNFPVLRFTSEVLLKIDTLLLQNQCQKIIQT